MRITTILLAVATMFFASCNNYQKTKTGISYKITSKGGKEKPKQGNVVKFNYELKVTGSGKDSLLRSTYDMGLPGYLMFDTAQIQKYTFLELLPFLAVGDKADFSISVDTLVKNKLIPEYDKLFKKGGTIKGKVELVKVYTNEKDAQADYQKDMAAAQEKQRAKQEKESAKEIAKESAAITKYIADNKLQTTKTPNGVFVSIEKPGDGPKADSGKQLMIMYKGYTLDGKVFDKNMEADAKHKDPLPVVLGAHQVIPGWEEGLKYFAKGGKGKMIIPFMQAYGPNGAGGDIPPYATLVFDVEIVDVKNPEAPKPVAPQQQATAPTPEKK